MSKREYPRDRKMKPYTPRWEKMANELARAFFVIVACPECGHPNPEQYVCSNCGCDR